MRDRIDNEAEELSNACYALLYDSVITKKLVLDDRTEDKIARFRLSSHYNLEEAQVWIKTHDAYSAFLNFIILYEVRGKGDRFSQEELNRFGIIRKRLYDWFSIDESNALRILEAYLH